MSVHWKEKSQQIQQLIKKKYQDEVQPKLSKSPLQRGLKVSQLDAKLIDDEVFEILYFQFSKIFAIFSVWHFIPHFYG